MDGYIDILNNIVIIYGNYLIKGIFDEESCEYSENPQFEKEIRENIAKITRKYIFHKISTPIIEDPSLNYVEQSIEQN
jgi:hypothetical protein